ncbi:hypothetical protein [Actinokineospora iranica]|uniref:Uncharacterized protein n=1 Tax=Actinokineospora iranica TaxID=1271860 RepID=A0A1G6TA03_9PSEU|nr:hypothetical protein [Actinokineospora iranica]SDD25155.1 hypothetical protein SAMN05216174_10915 [Actinokineospora iranica]
MEVNKGFQVFGGTVNLGQAAIGDNASVHIGQPDPTAALNTLRHLLATHEVSPGATELTDEVATELEQPTPDKGKLQRLLDALTKLVAPVEPVATAVSDLSTAVAAITS